MGLEQGKAEGLGGLDVVDGIAGEVTLNYALMGQKDRIVSGAGDDRSADFFGFD